MWFAYKLQPPQGARIFKGWFSLVGLFGETRETAGDKALWKKLCYWCHDLGSCLLCPHTPKHTYHVSYMSRGKQLLCHAPTTMMVCLTKIPKEESRVTARNLWKGELKHTRLPFRSSHQIMCHSDEKSDEHRLWILYNSKLSTNGSELPRLTHHS